MALLETSVVSTVQKLITQLVASMRVFLLIRAADLVTNMLATLKLSGTLVCTNYLLVDLTLFGHS